MVQSKKHTHEEKSEVETYNDSICKVINNDAFGNYRSEMKSYLVIKNQIE